MGRATGRAGRGEERGPKLDLHKSWHLLHYVFTGTTWHGAMPAGSLLNGGREVGEDFGYGPARVLDADETSAFAEFLDGATLEELRSRIDASVLDEAGIYGFEFFEDDEGADAGEHDAMTGQAVEDLEHFFPALQSFVVRAAKDRQGLVIWIT